RRPRWARRSWPASGQPRGPTPTSPASGSSTGTLNQQCQKTRPTRSRRSGGGPWNEAGAGRPAIISSLSSNGARPPRGRQRILYAEELWRGQRFYAGLLVVGGLLAAGGLAFW